MKLEIVRLTYDDLTKDARFSEKLRGYIGNKYIDNDLVHNHKDDKVIYRYPMVQYKVINKKPMIIGINEGSQIVKEISINEDELQIEDKIIESYQRTIENESFEFGEVNDYVEYEFVTPWIALNQKNSSQYRSLNNIQKEELLKRILIGNIISLSGGVNYKVEDKLSCWISLKEKTVTMKNIIYRGFVGRFKINFEIPNFIGIGKSVSRGFGAIEKLP